MSSKARKNFIKVEEEKVSCVNAPNVNKTYGISGNIGKNIQHSPVLAGEFRGVSFTQLKVRNCL